MHAINLNQSTVISETAIDPVLSVVMTNIRGGWSEHCPKDVALIPYWRHRRQLSSGNGFVMLGRRVVVPKSLQKTMLIELHQTHQGIQKMKSLARLHVWWPTIEEEIELHVGTCNSCQRLAPSPSAQNYPWPAAKTWERVHLDYGSFNGQDFLVLVDAGSKWIEAKFVRSTTTTTTLYVLYDWFTRFGFPQSIHTDGGPQFTSTEFRNKLADWNIMHSVSPPYHPQSNGMAERCVRYIKDALRKNSSSTAKLGEILFRYRTTPLSCGKTPSELLLGYNLRTRLNLTGKQKVDSLKNCKYKPGDKVWVRDYRRNATKWQEAIVRGLLGRTVVEVTVDQDRQIRRHLNQVRRRHSSRET